MEVPAGRFGGTGQPEKAMGGVRRQLQRTPIGTLGHKKGGVKWALLDLRGGGVPDGHF